MRNPSPSWIQQKSFVQGYWQDEHEREVPANFPFPPIFLIVPLQDRPLSDSWEPDDVASTMEVGLLP